MLGSSFSTFKIMFSCQNIVAKVADFQAKVREVLLLTGVIGIFRLFVLFLILTGRAQSLCLLF